MPDLTFGLGLDGKPNSRTEGAKLIELIGSELERRNRKITVDSIMGNRFEFGNKNGIDFDSDLGLMIYIIEANSELFTEPIINGFGLHQSYKESLKDAFEQHLPLKEAHKHAKQTMRLQEFEKDAELFIKKAIKEYFDSKLEELSKV
jgi:hypothetical protein